MTKWDLFQLWKVGLILGNLLVSYTILIDLREKKTHIISIDARKPLRKTQYLFFIKTLEKIKMSGISLA